MNTSAAGPALLTGQPTIQRRVILLVEDEAMVREVTRQVLEHAGYAVLECNGAEQALRVADEYSGRIGLLLTDVVMPGMHGAELSQRLESVHPGLVTVFMSGYAASDVLRTMKERNDLIHVQKPFTAAFLLSRIAEALEGNVSGGVRD